MGCRRMRFVIHAGEFGRCIDYIKRAGRFYRAGYIDHAASVCWWIHRACDGASLGVLCSRPRSAAARSKH